MCLACQMCLCLRLQVPQRLSVASCVSVPARISCRMLMHVCVGVLVWVCASGQGGTCLWV